MSEPIRIIHGAFGRVVLLVLDRSMVTHAHRICHVIFKIGGPDVPFGIREHETTLSDRNVLLVNAWEPHFYHHRQACPQSVLLALYLDPHWLQQIDRRFAYSVQPNFFESASASMSPTLARLRTDLLDLLIARENTRMPTVEQLIADVFTQLTPRPSHWPALAPAMPLPGHVAYDARIRRSLESMRERSGIEVDFDQVAREAGLSRPHFFHLFHKQTGMTPATFCNMLKLDSSIHAVSDAGLPLHEVALRHGFDAQGNFTRFFANQQGLTPSQYRRAVEFAAH